MTPTAGALRETKSACPYCGVGCGVVIEHDGERIRGVRGDPDHPANRGRLCSKGSTLHLTATVAVLRDLRALEPQQRRDRTAPLAAIGWDDALDLAADRIAAAVASGGPDRIGFYISGQLLTEEYHLFNKLAKGLVGTNNVDTNSRLCMSSAVAGYKQTLGADAPPCCYEDLALAKTLFITGSNAAWAHPILFRRIEDAKTADPSLRIVVVDPRRTETAEAADLHLAIEPGTDVALYHGMLHAMLREDLIDPAYIAAHTAGFEALRERVRDFVPEDVATLCGIRVEDLLTAARWFANVEPGTRRRAPTLSLWCQGLNQSRSGTDRNAALIGLHLATAQIGKPGAGPFSLTGQPNAMGGREVGGLATLLPGHREVANAAHRAEVARLWNLEPGRVISDRPGLAAVELFEAAADGRIDVLWIACTNPAQSMPDQALVRRALARVPFVVLQDAFATTATAAFADLLLPAATWGEKEGTVTNSERCITRIRRAVAPPGSARADARIVIDLARRLEARWRPHLPTLFPFEDAASVWTEHREATRGRDLDIAGLDWDRLDAAPAQWPFPAGATEGLARLYADGRFPTEDGRARFMAPFWEPPAEPRDTRHPFALTTGRLRDQWHGMSRTGTVPRLFGHAPEPAIDLHRDDMARMFLADGDLVRIESRRGKVVLPARAGPVKPMQASLPMHWGDEFWGGAADADARTTPYGVNALTARVACPVSKQPELKHTAVRVAPADLPWKLFGMAWFADEHAAFEARAELRTLFDRFPYASAVPVGRERAGVLFRAACAPERAPDDALLDRIEALLGLDGTAGGRRLRFRDPRRRHRRTLGLAPAADRASAGDAPLEAVLLAGDTRGETWLRPWLEQGRPAARLGHALLVASAVPPEPTAPPSRQVCTCFAVHESAIVAALDGAVASGADAERALAASQSALRCGTECGSCLPELRRLARDRASAAVPA